MDDFSDLIGVPFEYGGRGPDTFDCYGLVMEIHRRKGIELPDYLSPSVQEEIAAIFSTQVVRWEEVPRAPGTVVVLRVGDLFSHCGYMLDNERMIHAWRATGGVMIQKLDVWKHRILGFYRYAG